MKDQDSKGKVITLPSIGDCQYWLMPGNCPPNFSQVALHNKAFAEWREFWTQVFQQISGERVRAEDFWRQRVVCLLTKGQDIVAVHLYSFFHLDSQAALAHSYLRINYNESVLNNLREMGVKSAMSMEYLTVNSRFRSSALGFPAASVMLGLGCKVLADSGYDAAIGPCRRDVKVDQKVAEFGAVPFSEEFIHHGVPVIDMMLPSGRLKTHPDPQISVIVDRLWKTRNDLSEFAFKSKQTKQKQAA